MTFKYISLDAKLVISFLVHKTSILVLHQEHSIVKPDKCLEAFLLSVNWQLCLGVLHSHRPTQFHTHKQHCLQTYESVPILFQND